jgi:antitoxin (DNA-binding transcriptional repressor) of toxin-antitoxin stability system
MPSGGGSIFRPNLGDGDACANEPACRIWYPGKREEFQMTTATIQEVQAKLPEMLARLGGDEEVVILANGKPVGRLLPAPLPKGVPVRGRGKGKLTVHSDDDEHLKDFEEYLP